MKVQYFNFKTQYNQFYITSDNGSFLNTEIKADKKAYDMRLSIENNALVIFTQSYSKIKGEIEILGKSKNDIDYTKYDHIVEGGINIESGELKILSWPGSETELFMRIHPGKYRVRIYSSNLNSVKDYDLPHDTDNDYYRIELWKSDDMERKVLKQYEYKE